MKGDDLYLGHVRQHWKPSDGYFGLERAPLPLVAACIVAMAVVIVSAVATRPSWLQLVFLASVYGAAQWWRAAAAHRASSISR